MSTHILTSYATYDIPFGRDRKFGKNMNPVVNAIAGDWQVNAILSLHTGFALTTSGPDASGTNSRGARPDCLSPTSVFGHAEFARRAATSGSMPPPAFLVPQRLAHLAPAASVRFAVPDYTRWT